ncbi:hypothetical protein IW261DRAFT_1563524 [Armillaria novae-zelandiae]|uniref:Uncharacterized protein n=1 Tax=Armillaria novae-zelandiae TaxID=153914 RepID=A0AA39UIZ7_9AGAR|nr:hypothetical protein IW261DRAFT_1563524 [Armillaria novae-zelandiae]
MLPKPKKCSREQMLKAVAQAQAGHTRSRLSNPSSANSSAHVSHAPSPIMISSSDDDDDDVVILAGASKIQPNIEIQDINLEDSEDYNEQCNWNGETTHCIGYHTDSEWEIISDSGDDNSEESDEDIEELEGEELVVTCPRGN